MQSSVSVGDVVSGVEKNSTMAPQVWVVDASPTVRAILQTCLSREGFEVKTFSDGIEAFSHLITQHDVHIPDLIIIDIVLPKMDGYDVLQRLKARGELRETVFVVLSGRNGVLDRLQARLAGASEYLSKPFSLADVLHVLRKQLHLPSQAGQGLVKRTDSPSGNH